jgi:hypothetical protein
MRREFDDFGRRQCGSNPRALQPFVLAVRKRLQGDVVAGYQRSWWLRGRSPRTGLRARVVESPSWDMTSGFSVIRPESGERRRMARADPERTHRTVELEEPASGQCSSIAFSAHCTTSAIALRVGGTFFSPSKTVSASAPRAYSPRSRAPVYGLHAQEVTTVACYSLFLSGFGFTAFPRSNYELIGCLKLPF